MEAGQLASILVHCKASLKTRVKGKRQNWIQPNKTLEPPITDLPDEQCNHADSSNSFESNPGSLCSKWVILYYLVEENYFVPFASMCFYRSGDSLGHHASPPVEIFAHSRTYPSGSKVAIIDICGELLGATMTDMI